MKAKTVTNMLVVSAALACAPALSMAQSTNSSTAPAAANATGATAIDTWAADQARQNNGRISRDAYMQEMGRRWDANPNRTGTRDSYLRGLRTQWDTADRDNRGLTPADISKMTGKVDSSTEAMPKSGSGVQPGNMGPGSSKGQ